MVLYHRLDADSAVEILNRGFRDEIGYSQTETIFCGVWLYDSPFDGDSESQRLDYERLKEGEVLAVSIRIPLSALKPYEHDLPGGTAWCLPAKLLNDIAVVYPFLKEEYEAAASIFE